MSSQQFDQLAHFLATNAPTAPAATPGLEEQILRKLQNKQVKPSEQPEFRFFERSESGLIAALSLAASLALGLFVSLSGKRDHVSLIAASEILVEAITDLQTEEDSDDPYEEWMILASVAGGN